MHLYSFWEGANPPAYLDLCVETWYRHIPNLTVELINYSNLQEYVGPYLNVRKLKNFSLAMQSDVISSVVLASRGGTFIDIDTIMLPNVNTNFLAATNQKLNVFGIPSMGQFHVAIMSTMKENPAVVHWMNEACKRVDECPKTYPWNYLAGDLLERLTKDADFSRHFNIVDRISSGNILEASWNQEYKEFYFSEKNIYVDVESLVQNASQGLVSLHNSWTPKEYSQISSRKEVLANKNTLSRILSYSLSH